MTMIEEFHTLPDIVKICIGALGAELIIIAVIIVVILWMERKE